MKTQYVSRQQRRAKRLQRFVSNREAYRAAIRAGLDYRVSGESGAIVVHSHSLNYHRAKSPNITIPPAGRGWDKSGPARVVQRAQIINSSQVIREQSGNSGNGNKTS